MTNIVGFLKEFPKISFKSIICKALIVGVGTFISLSGAAYCFFPYPSLRPFSGPPPFLAFGANVGTGFFIGSNGDIVTNLHVVNSCRRITISGYRFQAEESKLAASDPDMDLALLHTKALPPSILPIAEGYWPIGSVKQVDAAMLALTPQESGKAITIGYHMLRTSAQVDPIQLSLTAHSHDRQHWYRLVHGFFQPGQSGSPIIYTSGKVAGVLSDIEDGTKWQSNIGLFIPGPIVRNFALSAGVVLPTVVNESPERAVVHIFCFTTLP